MKIKIMDLWKDDNAIAGVLTGLGTATIRLFTDHIFNWIASFVLGGI